MMVVAKRSLKGAAIEQIEENKARIEEFTFTVLSMSLYATNHI